MESRRLAGEDEAGLPDCAAGGGGGGGGGIEGESSQRISALFWDANASRHSTTGERSHSYYYYLFLSIPLEAKKKDVIDEALSIILFPGEPES